MKKFEQFFFLVLSILLGISLLEGYRAFLGWIHPQWRIILLLDIMFLGFLALYRLKSKAVFGITTIIIGGFLILALLESSWNLLLLIPTLLIFNLRK